MNKGLNSYARTINSQWGEDGIIEEIFKRIGTNNKFCVEFGAGYGFENSNVWNLINNLGWNALLMEPDIRRYDTWNGLLKNKPGSKVIHTSVDISGNSSIDNILDIQKAPKNLDLLSIDIDGDDYHIFNSLKRFNPRVLLIEHNPTIPPGDSIIQDPYEKESFGSSARANVDLAHKKGYKLVAMTHTNSIFVINDEFDRLKINEPSVHEVFDWDGLSYVISAYNGSLYLRNIKNADKNPSYSWLYKCFTIGIFNKAIAAGRVFNRPYSKTLSKMYQPIKAFKASLFSKNK